MPLKKFTSLVLITLTISTLTIAQTDQGWSSFKANDLQAARTNFKKAVSAGDKKNEAMMALLLLPQFDKTKVNQIELLTQLHTNLKDPNPYFYALWSETFMGKGGKYSKDELKFLDDLSESPKINGTLKAMIYQQIGGHYDAIGKFKKGDKYYALMGDITTWSVTGTFDNISGSGFDKKHDPIDHPEKTAVFKDKKENDIQWFNLTAERHGSWINFDNHFNYSNSIIFAQNTCVSPIKQDVYLRIGTSGSLKAWVNDQLVVSELKERNNDLDTYIVKVTLAKGNNRILLQIGESVAGASNFMVRITNKAGHPITGLSYSTEVTSYDKTAFETEVVPFFAEAYFLQKVEEDPENMLHNLMLVATYLHNDKTNLARKKLKALEQLAPKCSYVLWQQAEVFAREGNRSDLSKILEGLKESDPESAFVLGLRLDDAMEQENYDKAEEILTTMAQKLPRDENYYVNLIELKSEQNESEEMARLIRKAYNYFPENLTFTLYNYYYTKSIDKNKSGALSILKSYNKKNYSASVIELMAQHYFEVGLVSEGLAYMKRLQIDHPNGPGYASQLANIYRLMKRYPEALVYYKLAISQAPYVGRFYAGRAEVYKDRGDRSNARENYEIALKYNPNNYEAREELRKLKDKDPVFDAFEEPDFKELFANAPEKEAFPDDNSVILHNEIQNVVYEDGASEEKHILAIKMFNAAGTDDWKEYHIRYNRYQRLNIEKAEVYKKDGTKLKAETNYGTVVFPSLEEGDGVVLVYKIQNYKFGKLAHHFWDKHYFSLYYPCQKSVYTLLVHPDLEFKHQVINSDIEPEISTVDEFDSYVWQKTDIPSVKYDSYMPLLSDVGEVLHFSSIPDWDFVSDWYEDLSKVNIETEYEVHELVNELIPDPSKLTDREKVRIIYEYIVKNIRYSSVSFRQSGLIPQRPSDVLVTKIGDCKDVSTLFISMCKLVGIEDANLVLVNTRDNGQKEMVFPSIDFNHCIAHVDIENDPYYVELTSDLNGFSTIGYSLKNAFVLDIDPKTESAAPQLLNPKTRLKNQIIRTSDVTFSGSTMHVKKSSIRTGSMASGLRSTYKDVGKKEQRKTMSEAIGSDYANARLEDVDFGPGLDNQSDSVDYRYSYKVNDVFSSIGSLDVMKMPWSDAEEPMDFMSSVEERKYGVEFWRISSIDLKQETMTVNLPAGKTLLEVPKSLNYDCPLASYSLTFKRSGSQLVITRSLKLKSDVIKKEDLLDVRSFFEKVVKADSQQIAFKAA